MRNSKLIVSTALAIGAIVGIGAVSAADLPARTYTKAAVMVDPAYNWSGFYIGGEVGGAWSNSTWSTNHRSECANFTVACDPSNLNTSSITGGGQIGGRYQTGSWVFGVEGSWAYTGLKGTTLTTFALDPPPLPSPTYGTSIRSIYTVTGQAGYAWNKTLWYVKGGWAGGDINQNSTAGLVAPFAVASVSRQAHGWTAGTGLEYAFAKGWSVAGEYDYVRLNAGNVSTCTTGGVAIFDCQFGNRPLLYQNFRANVNQVMLRLNYTFGPTSVVAKY
jgi:outer membrane immunogenic protein